MKAVISGFRWVVPPSVLVTALGEYEKKVLLAIQALAVYFAAMMESHAKATAPWTDRTGNARQGLAGATELASDVVHLYLVHGMSYGVYLETRWGGKYAVIMPTIQAHLGEISSQLQAVLG